MGQSSGGKEGKLGRLGDARRFHLPREPSKVAQAQLRAIFIVNIRKQVRRFGRATAQCTLSRS